MQVRRVVITGLGTVTSLGLGTAAMWDGLCQGRSGITSITLFDASGFESRIASEVKNFDPSPWMDVREARRMERFCWFAIASADEAVKDSGLDFTKEDRTRAGVLIGSGIGGLGEMETQHGKLLDRGPDRVSPFLIPKLMINAAPGQISIRYGLQGPNSAVATACSSGTHALGEALRAIQCGEAEIMLAGGSEGAITPLGLAGFCTMKALSTRNDSPTQASRPFDNDRDGFVMGEGAGIAVLEELEHARKRGARIYGEFAGFGRSGDGFHITQPEPEGKGAALAMTKALADAEIAPDKLTYINAHGTSTQLNDVMESRAVRLAFGPHAGKVAVSSTKSMLGHLLGAAGGVEFVISTLAVYHNIIPPTINYTTPDPACDLDYVPNTAREMTVNYAMSNTLGFGGHNASVVVGKFTG
ncbi:MAG TPA: beta-ketoacyl-ACP synthase II [Planctomycetota bacterium]|nr:beta-ketoacyl-ACP synthase II [Planctomycetota bacterium]